MKKQMATVDCPKSMVGRVIGKNGETIRALQNYTGALIQIDQTVNPMKVTISGTLQSLNLAISMVTDIVNGTFKGFAMLRQIANEQAAVDSTLCQPVYAAGYGLIPPSQLFTGISDGRTAAVVSPTIRAVNSPGKIPFVNPPMITTQEEKYPSAYILGLTSALKNLSLDSCSTLQASSASLDTMPSLSTIDSFMPGFNNFPKTQAIPALSQSNYNNVIVSESQLLSQLLSNAALPKMSFSEVFNIPATNELMKMPRCLPQQPCFNNIRVLCDPNGRLFYLDESTGQVQWVDDTLRLPALALSAGMLTTN